jgi:uncharacterized membrane protein YfcA
MELFHLTSAQWFLCVFSAVLIGFSKTGIGGVATLMVPIMASIFGGKASSGIVLPMLVFGDLIAVNRYRKHADKRHVMKLLPWAVAGLILGLAVGNLVNDAHFKMIIGVTVIAGLAVMIILEKRSSSVPEHWAFAAILGLAGGFSTMVGNAAGTVMSVYLLSMRLPKYSFIGTGAWFFMIINLIKIPLQIIFWHGITPQTLVFNAMMIPPILIGAFIGIHIVRKLPEKPFRYMVMALTAVAAAKLFF